MITIYGLRQIGTDEIRYIGRSGKPLPLRLAKHVHNARHGYPPHISDWINQAKHVEIVPIATCAGEDGCAVERWVVEQYWSDGHRLSNSHLIPRARQSGAAA